MRRTIDTFCCHAAHARAAVHGFTLVELMITVAILGILIAITIPSYREQVAKGRRSQAKAVLLQAQQWMERFYSENYRYDKNMANVGINDTTLFPAQFSTAPMPGEGAAAYTISVTASSRTQTGRKSVINYSTASYASALLASRACW